MGCVPTYTASEVIVVVGERTMSHKSHSTCPTCARICDDAKAEAKRLNKKVYAMTIALTSALTLLGKEAAKEVIAYVKVVQDSTDSGGGESAGANSATAASSDDADHPEPRTRPFIHKESTPSADQSTEAAKDKSNSQVGLSAPRTALDKQLMDAVNGKMPSMGELVEMPVLVPKSRRADSDGLAMYYDVDPYRDNTVIDPNARFVTDSPFGGYPQDDVPADLPAPTTVAVLGIVPLIGSRRR